MRKCAEAHGLIPSPQMENKHMATDSETIARAILGGRRMTSINAVIRAYGLSNVLKHIALHVGTQYAQDGGDVKLYEKLVSRLIGAADLADKTAI